MYCLGCKDFTHNFRPQEETRNDKQTAQKKSQTVVCRSNKSRCLKQKHNTKK